MAQWWAAFDVLGFAAVTEGHTKTRTALVVGDADATTLAHLASDNISTRQVDTVDEALDAIRQTSFDVIVNTPGSFIGLSRSHLGNQFAGVLENIDRALGVFSMRGEQLFANQKFATLPDAVRARVRDQALQAAAAARQDPRAALTSARSRRFSFPAADGGQFEMTATCIVDLHNLVTHIVVIAWDVSSARRLQEKLDAIDQAGRELVSLDVEQFSSLHAQARLALLEKKILRCTRELLHFDNFEVRVLDRSNNRLDVILSSGLNDGEAGEIYATTEGNGISGYVAARGKSYICPDTTADPRYLPGLAQAQSSLTVPLKLHDRVIGVANFESTKPAAFSEDDRQFAEIFGRYVALALHILQLLVSERQTTAGQLCDNVATELTGPLNDLLTETETLIEDYIGHDDVRLRLRHISENAVKIRNTLRELTNTKAGLVGASCTTPKTDPLLAGRRILVADDEDVMRDTLRDVLMGCGCVVTTASDGSSAVRILDCEKFDLVLSDIKMPGKDGYDVFAAAKRSDAATPVILTTGFGYDPRHSVVRAQKEGLAAVLFKPFKVDQLLVEVRKALGPRV